MEPIVMYYEEESDNMPKLRPLVLPHNLAGPFNKVVEKKMSKTFNERGHVRPANEFLEAFLETNAGRVVLFYVADLMHKLGLSVSYEMFRQESGYDLFQVSLRHQMEEQIQFMDKPGYDETEPQIIYKLSDFVNGQSFYNQNPELSYDRDVVNEIWDDLNLWPAVEPGRKPAKRGRPVYGNVLLDLTQTRPTQRRRVVTRARNSGAVPGRRC